MASEINARIAKGENPAEEKRAIPELTLAELWREYLERHAKPHKKPRSLEEDEGLWNRHIKPWQRRRLVDITKKEVATLHARIGEQSGHYAANRMHSLLRHMFNLAIQWELFEGSNPCLGVTRFKEKSRERFIQPNEMPSFIAALYQEPDETLRDVILLLLLTGARKSNVMAMQFEDVDFGGQVWRIPDSKSGETLTLPLVPMATVNPLTPLAFPSSRKRPA